MPITRNLTNLCHYCWFSFVNLPESDGNLFTASQLKTEKRQLQARRGALKLQLMVTRILFGKILP